MTTTKASVEERQLVAEREEEKRIEGSDRAADIDDEDDSGVEPAHPKWRTAPSAPF